MFSEDFAWYDSILPFQLYCTQLLLPFIYAFPPWGSFTLVPRTSSFPFFNWLNYYSLILKVDHYIRLPSGRKLIKI